ncbi:MAG TPA: MraY family glycosyltransferase [Symbiobacteriaceae bacterium]
MSMELRVFLAWSAALGVTYLLTPVVAGLAHRTGLVDVPRGRHAHERPTPLLGGLAMAAGVMAGAMLLAPDPALAVTLPLALLAGLVDDYRKCRDRDLPAVPKLILQFLPATVLVLMGHTIHHVSNPLGSGMLLLPWWLDYPLTLMWLVGMTNAINFLDGMDGLAAGICSVATFTLMILALAKGDVRTAVWVAATLGACLAFLRYNFPPASIFMGDAGSNFLGFLLAAVSVTGYFKAATLAGLAAPLLIFSIPMLNVVYVVVRRIRQGKGLIQALTEGDLEHSFNVFRRRTNFTTTETVLVFLMLAMLLSASALGVAFAYR